MLSTTQVISHTGLSPAMVSLSKLFCYVLCYHMQAPPISLATTFGISVDVFSSSYLDVSVHPLTSLVYNLQLYRLPHPAIVTGKQIGRAHV